jgi:hypothetical protein
VNPAFTRGFDRILARLGSDAVFRSAPIRVVVEHDVEVADGNGDVVQTRTVATMARALQPLRHEALTIEAEAFVIDSPPFADNGVSVSVVLRKVDA